MKKDNFIIILLFTLLFPIIGCGRNDETVISETAKPEAAVKSAAESLLDAFLAGEIPAVYGDGAETGFMFDQLPSDEQDYFRYSVGERIDLDNDGEDEQIVDGPYGGIYFDARDGKVYVLAEGEGTTGVLFYTNYENVTWIVHSDTTHVGRQTYWLTRYDGEGNVVDEFRLSAEYWDSPDDNYNENSDFTYREEKISMQEYEALRNEIVGVPIDDSTSQEIPTGDAASEVLQEIPTEENGMMELYNGGDVITVSKDKMIAGVSPQDILKGNPVLYDRFRTDGWVFEWLISDYHDDERLWEDGVLMVSREEDTEVAQIIQITAEGGYGSWVSIENKFEYVDVNFDDIPDLLICTGHHGNQGLLTYYCFLQTKNGFVESPTFTDIANPAVDADNKLILSQWRNSAASHSWAKYKLQDNKYIMERELCEELNLDTGKEIWVWTVNGVEIGRSDKLSEEEIEDLIYNENNEWNITGDKWQTLYHSGLTTDYSIYSEP